MAGTRQQAHDEACRRRMLQELMKTAASRSRIETDDERRHNKKARVESSVNDEPMSHERGRGRSDHGASSSNNCRDDGSALGQRGSGSERRGASISSSVPMVIHREGAAAMKRARLRSMHVERSELAEPLEKKYKGSSSGSAAATEHTEDRESTISTCASSGIRKKGPVRLITNPGQSANKMSK